MRAAVRRGTIAVSVVLGVALVVVAGPAGSSAPPPPLPSTGALFGARVGFDPSATDRRSAQTAFEATVGRAMALDRQYYAWNEAWPTADDAWSRDAGRTLYISWNSRTTTKTWTSWASIASGAWDATIDARAANLAAFGAPVIFSFHHEPEGDPAGTTADFVAAYRHIRDRFLADGLTNVLYAWTMSAATFGTASANAYYPGDDAVDVVASDGYNWAYCPSKPSATWKNFGQIFQAFHTFGAAHDKPMVIAEWGTNEDPNTPGRKATWIDQASTQLMRWPDIRGAIYYNENIACPRQVDSSPSSLASFRQMGADPYFSPPPAVSFTSGPASTTTGSEADLSLTAPGAAGIRCRLDGGAPVVCDSGALHLTGLGGVSHVLDAWGVDANGGQITASTRWIWSVDLPNDVILNDRAFTPSSRTVSAGTTQLFSFAGPGTHTVTDASGMGLFDSGPKAVGSLAGVTIPGAGSYAYRCTIITSMTGTLKANMTASPTSGKTATVFTLSWAGSGPPNGFGFDVQVKRPGSSTWVSLRNDTLTPSATWTPTNGTGTYQFRTRLQRLGATAASGWSAALSVSVTS